MDFDETFTPIARIESIRVLLALACHLKFKLYQMDVKSAFLNGFLKEEVNGFIRGYADQTFFIEKVDGELVVAQVYVDDIIFGSTKDDLAHSFSSMMQIEFEISMIRELNYFLGLQIRQSDLGIFISQYKYAKNLVKKFGLESTSFVRTPMSPNVKLTVDLLGKNADPSLYRSMTGSLLYLTASRPNISYNVGMCARY